MTSVPNVNVSIMHNVTPDEHGHPTKGMIDGWGPNDTLECVFTFALDTPDSDHMILLEMIFHEFNVGEGFLAIAYRAKDLRSLSVGDVVIINDVAYECGRFGWGKIDVISHPEETPSVDFSKAPHTEVSSDYSRWIGDGNR